MVVMMMIICQGDSSLMDKAQGIFGGLHMLFLKADQITHQIACMIRVFFSFLIIIK